MRGILTFGTVIGALTGLALSTGAETVKLPSLNTPTVRTAPPPKVVVQPRNIGNSLNTGKTSQKSDTNEITRIQQSFQKIEITNTKNGGATDNWNTGSGGSQTKSKGVPNLVKGATYCTGPGCGGPPPK